MKKEDKLIQVLKEYTADKYTESVIKSIKPSIRLQTSFNKKISLGNTKFGGSPHLSKELVWPQKSNSNEYLSFLAQINLEEIHSKYPETELPKNGILYFFLNFDNPKEGKIIYEKKPVNLEVTKTPKVLLKETKTLFQKLFKKPGKQYHILKEMGVFTEMHFAHPPEQSLNMYRIIKEINPDAIFHKTFVYNPEIHESALFYDEREDEMSPNHHLIGYEDIVQFGFHEENIIPPKTKLDKMSLEEINNTLKWKLLFQCDSDKNLNLSWGDWGKVYFFIHEDDLQNCNFENVKINWSCY